MKKNHGVLKFFIGILIAVLITVLGFSLTLRGQSNKVIKEMGLARAISNHLMDNMFNIDVSDSHVLNSIWRSMKESTYVDKIANKITDRVIENALDGKKKYEYVDLKPELEKLCDQSASSIKSISPNLYDKIRTSMKKLIPDVERTINEHAKASIEAEFSREDTPQMKILNAYIFMTSLHFRIACAVALILLLFAYWKLSVVKSDFLKGMGICAVVSAVAFLILQLFGNEAIMYMSNKYMGRTVTIDLQYYVEALIYGGLGIIWFICGMYMNKRGR